MKQTFLIFSALFFFNFGYSQGCSDAGFCSVGTVQHQGANKEENNNQLKIGVSSGKADFDVNVFTTSLEYNRKIGSNFDMDVKLNFQSNSLDNTSVSALSDAFLIGNFKINKDWKTSFGVKIPLTDGNLKENEVVLPMDFQPSLGTFDLLLAVSKKVNKFDFSLAYQQPLSQNKNEYVAPLNGKFFTTKGFKRSGDVLLRASYKWKFAEKLNLTPSILPIYHLANDKYLDGTTEKEIEKSSGLTLNANLFLNYLINESNALQLSFGSPLIVRDARPDGLTRKYVVGLQYVVAF
jgi:hypothetical protein